MAPSQMGMWQGSLEVFCGAVLNKKSSLPTKKRGLDLRSPDTVASPSSTMAFNTFLYTAAPHKHRPLHNHGSCLRFWFHLLQTPARTCCTSRLSALIKQCFWLLFRKPIHESTSSSDVFWKMLKNGTSVNLLVKLSASLLLALSLWQP